MARRPKKKRKPIVVTAEDVLSIAVNDAPGPLIIQAGIVPGLDQLFRIIQYLDQCWRAAGIIIIFVPAPLNKLTDPRGWRLLADGQEVASGNTLLEVFNQYNAKLQAVYEATESLQSANPKQNPDPERNGH